MEMEKRAANDGRTDGLASMLIAGDDNGYVRHCVGPTSQPSRIILFIHKRTNRQTDDAQMNTAR